MKDLPLSNQLLAHKDEVQRPIPTAWRGVLKDIVEAFVAGDYRLERGVASVEPVSAETAVRIAGNLQDYGATLIALPEATWTSSVCIWYGGHWDALIDLWTQEEGPSDLVLQMQVAEANPGFIFKIHLVYVP